MKSIIYVGMDVHSTNYTLSCYTIENDMSFATVQMEPDYKKVLKYLEKVQKNVGSPCEFLCGYEAGCLGYTLYHQLKDQGVNCVILAPTTMPVYKKNELKTDKRDAMKIAKCLAYNTYSPVHIPTKEDSNVKEYIRMRDDHQNALKRIKQQILALCLRYDKKFTAGKGYWTIKHLAWLKALELDDVLREALDEYLLTYDQLIEKIKRYDARIEELADNPRYRDNVKKLTCMIGIKTYTALAVLVETGDFKRFAKADQYAAFLGVVPGEKSSGESQNHTEITKAGNTHLRRLLTESAHCYSRSRISCKSKALKSRQAGNDPWVINYADKANDRLRRKFYRMILQGKKRNIVVTAVARELACFIWGMMTEHIA